MLCQYVYGQLINCVPIDQLVRIDELLEKTWPIDQLRQLINWAQQVAYLASTLEGENPQENIKKQVKKVD
jgi:hypothetical protein